jgi:replicative DNA helicase Mcm
LEVSFDKLRRGLPDLADDLFNHPDQVHEHLLVALKEYDLPFNPGFDQATVRIVDMDVADQLVWTIGEFTPSQLTQDFEILRGQVTRVSQTKQRFERAIYECKRCGTRTEMNIPETADNLPEPHECSGCERQGPFVKCREDMQRHSTDHQMLRLQTPPENAQQTTESMDVVLEGDLTKTASPGDRVTVGAELDVIIDEDGSGPPTGEYRANSKTLEVTDSDFSQIDYSEHEDRIEEIANSLDPYEKIIDSILPSHHGNRRIKEALAYQLVEGVKKEKADGSETRGKLHILLIGDPGVGKSQLLRYVNRISPRSVMTMGSGSTQAGLTCAAVKDDFGDGAWTLKAGALVEAHNGICLIDELDDMEPEDRGSMATAMSDGEINVAKAGMKATMPSETSVLAAANPQFGRFDAYEPIGEQVDIADNLITRFDLIFPMQDQPDADEDEQIADKVLDSDQAAIRREKRGGVDNGEDAPEIKPDVLRAYIARARELKPELSDGAKQRIKNHYVTLRNQHDEESPIPITARTLQTLERIAEASARLRLSETAEAEDADRAIEIYMTYMSRVGIDPETGEMDADRIETGQGQSQRTRMKAVRNVIQSLETEYDTGAPHDAVVDHPSLDEYEDSRIEHSIENLMEKGEIYESRNNHYRSS